MSRAASGPGRRPGGRWSRIGPNAGTRREAGFGRMPRQAGPVRSRRSPVLTLVVGAKNYSSWSLRAWLALRVAGIAFDEVVIPLDRPETKAEIARHSPSGRVPVLRDGDLRVWDSLAIIEYAAERFPDSRLWPADRIMRATARSVAAEMHAGFQALRAHLPMNLKRRPAA